MQTLKETHIKRVVRDGLFYEKYKKVCLYKDGHKETITCLRKVEGQGTTIEKPERVVKMTDILDSYAEYLETLSF